MLFTKVITFMLGCALLSPFIWSFGQMIFHDAKAAERSAAAQIESMMKEQALEEMSDGKNSSGEVAMNFSAIGVSPVLTIHPTLGRVWVVSPRPWVGLVGMACCLVMLGLLALSSFKTVTYHSPMLTTKPSDESLPEAWGKAGRAIWETDQPVTNKQAGGQDSLGK